MDLFGVNPGDTANFDSGESRRIFSLEFDTE